MASLSQLQRRIRDERRQGGAALGADAARPEGAPGPPPAQALAHLESACPALFTSLSKLNSAQVAAVLDQHPATLVAAQVGSGKTTVLVHKVLYLHKVLRVPLSQIAVLTFTNKAAREIRQRLAAAADAAGASSGEAWLMGTFHGVAATLLRESLPLADTGYRRDFTILDDDASAELREGVIARHKLKVGRRRSLRKRLADVEAPSGAESNDVRRLRDLLAAEKRQRNVMGFDDLLDLATSLLSSPRALFRRPVSPSWVLVDEAQDCEARELAFLRRLVAPETCLFAVGDAQQAIYGFRNDGPFFDACQRIVSTWGCRGMDLPRNYRSTTMILDAARSVLGPDSQTTALVGSRERGTAITVARHKDAASEATHVADRVAALRKEGMPLSDVAILFRLRSQGLPLAQALRECGLPVRDGARDEQPIASVASGEEPGQAVSVLTLHAAKGLEFRHVFICGLNQGVLPLGFTDAPEERRLLFVGITRARDTVELSYLARPEVPQALGLPSAYLGKIPADLVQWKDLCQPAPAAPAPARPASPCFHLGQRVRHPRYGQGVITNVTEDAIDCDFGGLGIKSFSAKLCALVPV